MSGSLAPVYVAAGTDRRSRTHAKLMDAAVSLFAERGVEATSVLEITARAKVSNGTFYNYFNSRDEIAVSVFEYAQEYLLGSIISNLNAIEDARHQVAMGATWFVRGSTRDCHWGRVMMHGLHEAGRFREESERTMAGYINRGVVQGHFQVEVTPTLLDLLNAILASAIRSFIEREETGLDIGLFAAEMHLRMLGLGFAQARQVSREALEIYGASPGSNGAIQRHYRSPAE